MSALISGVKNFVSIGDSLVRALPFSQVKSAKENGSGAGVLAAPDLPFSVASGPTAATRSLERESAFAGFAPKVILGGPAATDSVAAVVATRRAADPPPAATTARETFA